MKNFLLFSAVGLMAVAASAGTLVGTCSLTSGSDPAVNTSGGTPDPQIVNAVYTCNAFAIPLGDTVISADIFIGNDYSLGAVGSTNTVDFSYAISGFSTTNLSTYVSGSGISSSTGGILSVTPVGTCVSTGTNAVDCTDSPLALMNPSSFNAVTVTGSSTWMSGGVGAQGSDQFNVQETLTYTTGTPEPGSLMLLGSGLLAAGLIGRKKLVRK